VISSLDAQDAPSDGAAIPGGEAHVATTTTVALVAHGGTIRWLVRLVLGLPADTRLEFAAGDTCLFEFEFRDASTVIRRMNDTSHLG